MKQIATMKQISVISALILSATLMGCGGGASTSDDKPASLLPDGFVLSSASSSSAPAGNGSSSSIANGAKTTLPVYENFEAVDIDGFLSANYKHLSTDTTLPLYYVTSGYPVSTNPDGVPRILLTNWTSKALWLSNSRFTLGQTRLEAGTTSADPTVATWGELDLSKPYKLSFCVKDTKPSTSKRMMIFVDNNTTVQANSIHGNGNRIMYELTSVLVPGQRYTVTSAVGSSSSFLQVRVESGTDVVIDDLVLEYQDAPYTGSIPTCVVDTSFVRPVATASSASSAASSVVSSVASSAASSASSSSVSSSASSDAGTTSSTASSASSSSTSSTPAPSIAWNVYNADLHPTTAGSLILADGSSAAFSYSGASPANADFFAANGAGIMAFTATTAADKLYAQYNPIVPTTITYPRHYTAVIRAKGDGTNRVLELDTSLLDGTSGSRVKLILRADGTNQGAQVEKVDGTLSLAKYDSAVPYNNFRTYQLVITLATATTGSVDVYVPGNDTPVITYATGTLLAGTANYVRIGDGGSSAFKSDLDWLIWTESGSYKPSELVGKLPSGLGDTTGY